MRAVDVAAPGGEVFRWLCQLRVAPYSYDWIDNRGRRSPRKLTPGLEQLEVGQRCMTIFRLAEFEDGRSITLVHDGPLFGRVAVTYKVTPTGAETLPPARAAARALSARDPRGSRCRSSCRAGDLVMMRRQLLNLRDRAEGARLYERARGA